MNVRLGIMLVRLTAELLLIHQGNVLSVVDRELAMHIIVRTVLGWRRIAMDVQRLLIWGVRGRICFMRGESWDKLDLSLVEGKCNGL